MDGIKVVVVGDGGVGKTSLLLAYAEKRFPTEYVPTVFDNYEVLKETELGKTFLLSLWDTAGQEDYSNVRPMSYPGADVMIVCFALNSKSSFMRLEEWLAEIEEHAAGTPFLIVGTKNDLRDKEKLDRSFEEIESYAKKLGALAYFECSAKRMENIDEIFDYSIQKCAEEKFRESKSIENNPADHKTVKRRRRSDKDEDDEGKSLPSQCCIIS